MKIDNTHTHEPTKAFYSLIKASQSHIGLGHTAQVPNKGNPSLIITINIINLHKALDIRKNKSEDEDCSIKGTLLLLGY